MVNVIAHLNYDKSPMIFLSEKSYNLNQQSLYFRNPFTHKVIQHKCM